MVQSNFFQVDNETPWQDAGPGAQRQVYGFDDNLMLVKVQFEKGAVGAMHTHPHSQASYVASGAFELIIGDQKKVVGAGDGFYVPPHVLHGCTCLEAGMLIDAFSPRREDFL
ncbi:cupin domain-containing protein [Niabella sp. CC-SYL272]|uniref:cupin domain-containing protein n=1 Tax=Niabella agricola TaxID=2891571 RepID=UPI001F344545|nr:cupin domain-containing protein [Niabella agricola]MCF3111153.1 cupin domain-containing protein [Niabella agricola]